MYKVLLTVFISFKRQKLANNKKGFRLTRQLRLHH